MIEEVFSTPMKRLDNEISRISDALQEVWVYCKLVRQIQGEYTHSWWFYQSMYALTAVAMSGLTGIGLYFAKPQHLPTVASVGFAWNLSWLGGGYYLCQYLLKQRALFLTSSIHFQTVFQRVFVTKSLVSTDATGAMGDQSLVSIWIRKVLRYMLDTFNTDTLQSIAAVSNDDIEHLETMIQVNVPRLRKRAALALFQK